VIAKKRLPSLGWRTPSPRHVLCNGGLPDIDAELEQFAVYPRCSPKRVRDAHVANELTNLPRYLWSASRIAAKSEGKLTFGFLLGLAIALWSANAGMKAIFDALNLIYDEDEKRGLIWLNVVSLFFTICAIAGAGLAIALVVVFPVLLAAFGLTSSDPLREIQHRCGQDQNAKECEHDDDGQGIVTPKRGQSTSNPMPTTSTRPRPFHLVVFLATSVGGFVLGPRAGFDHRLLRFSNQAPESFAIQSSASA
jgi:virulence factor BrkB